MIFRLQEGVEGEGKRGWIVARREMVRLEGKTEAEEACREKKEEEEEEEDH
jgi:hypothetical protein